MPTLCGHLLFQRDYGSRNMCVYLPGLWVSPCALSSPHEPIRPGFLASLSSTPVCFCNPYFLACGNMCPSASQGDSCCHSCLPFWDLAQEVPFMLGSFFPHPTECTVPASPLAWACPCVLFFHCGQVTRSPAQRCI